MKDAMLVWPRLSTVLLIQLILRLWVWAILLAVLLKVVPFSDVLEELSKKDLPGYMSSIVLLIIAALVDRIVDLFLSKQSFWGACETLLQGALVAKGLAPGQPAFMNMRAMRVRGNTQAWRASMELLESSMSSPPDPKAGSNDAAQRLAPWAIAGVLLFLGVLLFPIWWPYLMNTYHLSTLQLTLGALVIGVLASLLSGFLASLVVAPWIRTRCL